MLPSVRVWNPIVIHNGNHHSLHYVVVAVLNISATSAATSLSTSWTVVQAIHRVANHLGTGSLAGNCQ